MKSMYKRGYLIRKNGTFAEMICGNKVVFFAEVPEEMTLGEVYALARRTMAKSNPLNGQNI